MYVLPMKLEKSANVYHVSSVVTARMEEMREERTKCLERKIRCTEI